MSLETLALAFMLIGCLGLGAAIWKGDAWCIGIAIGFVVLSCVIWYTAR